jgi:hypothetical protein
VKTIEQDPIPVKRLYAHALLSLMVVGVLVEVTVIAAGPWRAGKDSSMSLEWMATWGSALSRATPDALLAYVALTLVLYGISIGGQSAFPSASERTRVRRTVGFMGAILAMSTMALFFFSIAAAIADQSLVPPLLIIVPTALPAWLLGVEVSRFVVPRHGRQLELAEEQLTLVETQLARLPAYVEPLAQAAVSLAARGIGVGLLLGVTVIFEAPRLFLPTFLIGLTFCSLSLGLVSGITSSNIVETKRRSRGTATAMAGIFFGLLVLLGAANLLAMSGSALIASAVFLVVMPLLLISYRGQATSPVPTGERRRWSLRAGAIALEDDSLRRKKQHLEGRINQLRQTSASPPPRTARKRILAAVRELLD